MMSKFCVGIFVISWPSPHGYKTMIAVSFQVSYPYTVTSKAGNREGEREREKDLLPKSPLSFSWRKTFPRSFGRPPCTSHCSELGHMPVLEPVPDKGQYGCHIWQSLIMIYSWGGSIFSTLQKPILF